MLPQKEPTIPPNASPPDSWTSKNPNKQSQHLWGDPLINTVGKRVLLKLVKEPDQSLSSLMQRVVDLETGPLEPIQDVAIEGSFRELLFAGTHDHALVIIKADVVQQCVITPTGQSTTCVLTGILQFEIYDVSS